MQEKYKSTDYVKIQSKIDEIAGRAPRRPIRTDIMPVSSYKLLKTFTEKKKQKHQKHQPPFNTLSFHLKVSIFTFPLNNGELSERSFDKRELVSIIIMIILDSYKLYGFSGAGKKNK